MKAAVLRDMSAEELRGREGDLRRELFNLRMQSATGEIQNPMRIRAVRKDIARVLMVLNEMTKKAEG